MEKTIEVCLAQELASNLPQVREDALKKVETWLHNFSFSDDALTEECLLKLWKGIFYYFWNCDKMLNQEKKASVLSKYVHVFQTFQGSLLYIDTFFQTMAREWYTIDQYRIEKYLKFVRKFLHECYQLLSNNSWELDYVKPFLGVLQKTVLSAKENSSPSDLKMHISDVYMEELAKVGSKSLSSDNIQEFLIPYCILLCNCEDFCLIENVRKEVFFYLINQDIEDAKKFTELPILSFDIDSVQKLLMQYAKKPSVKRKNRKILHSIVQKFEDYKNGVDRLEESLTSKSKLRKLGKRDIEKATFELIEEEKKSKAEKKRHRKEMFAKIKEDLSD